MKKVSIILLICIAMLCFVGCQNEKNEAFEFIYRTELKLKVRMYYEYGDTRYGQEVEGGIAYYEYDGKRHCPEPRFFYKETEVFPVYRYVFSADNAEGVGLCNFVEKGTYAIKVRIPYQNKYDDEYVANQTFTIVIS